MATSPGKGYSCQTAGSSPGTWGVGAPTALNEGVILVIDNNLTGVSTFSVSSSNVTLSASDVQNCMLRFTGTLTGNIVVSPSNTGSPTPASLFNGTYLLENLTSGNFTITLTTGVGSIAIPQGGRSTAFVDQVFGPRLVGGYLPTGTSQTFFNATAPPGWTKSTSIDNGTMRIVSGTGGGTGGSADFASVFTARTILQANLPNYNLTVNDPSHTHTITLAIDSHQQGGSGRSFGTTGTGGQVIGTNPAVTGISVNSGGSGSVFDFSVKYADAILCTVN